MAPVTHLPKDARFTCQSCGRCCQGWAVPVDRATAERLRARDWGSDPFVATPGASHEYRIKLVGGRCFFLDAQNRCRIHSEVSYDAKPAACRAFPLAVLEAGGGRYARLSYWCPTVVANTGKPLEHQAQWIKDVSRHTDTRNAAITIDGQRAVSARDLDALHRALQRLQATVSPLADRVAAIGGVAARLAGAAAAGPADLSALAARAEADGVGALAAEARTGGHAASGRRALALYLVFDAQGGRLTMLLRTLGVLLSGLGLAALSSRALQAGARWPTLRKIRFEPSVASDALLARYFASKIDARRYLAGETTLVSGLNLLVVAYGIVRVLAQMRAASEGRAACDDGDVRAAVSAADLLVVEHGGHDHGQLHARLTRAVLASPALPADVLSCIESR